MPSALDISNQALAEIFSAPIADMDEQSVEAQSCTRFFQSSLDEMLELHTWSFVNTRNPLASGTNDRPAEWGFAYSLPVDCAMPLRVIPDTSSLSPSVDFAYYGPWLDWAQRGFPWDQGYGMFYDVEGAMLYSWIPNAILEYVSRSAALSGASSLFARALALDLASKIVSPLKKSRELKGDLIRQAEVAKQRAVAADMNRQPQQNAPYISEAAQARQGSCGLSY